MLLGSPGMLGVFWEKRAAVEDMVESARPYRSVSMMSLRRLIEVQPLVSYFIDGERNDGSLPWQQPTAIDGAKWRLRHRKLKIVYRPWRLNLTISLHRFLA
jgi:hypothetical protein